MRVIVNIPDEAFENFIKGCEKRMGRNDICQTMLPAILNRESYEIKHIDSEDIKLYNWLAAVVVNEMFGENI